MHYGEDLTHIHDAGFTSFVRNAADAALGILRAHGLRSGLVVDLGCGGGVWARRLVDEGYEAMGVDLSAGMIELARRREPRARFVCASFLDAEIPPCAAVTSFGECLNYLMDKRNDADALSRLFARIHAALRPGGLLLFDVATPGRCPGGAQTKAWVEDDWAMFAETTEAGDELVRRITTFRRVSDGHYRRGEETHRLRLYEPEACLGDLRSVGFEATLLGAYGDFAWPTGLSAFLAVKRG